MSIIIPYDMSKKYTEQNTVFPADLTGQADGDYIRNDAGVWKPRTTRNVIMRDVLGEGDWIDLSDHSQTLTDTAAVGTGQVAKQMLRWLQIITGTTAGGTARVATPRYWGWQGGANLRILNWGNDVMMKFGLNNGGVYTANGKTWVFWGDLRTGAVADPTSKGIGIRIDGRDLKGIVHDGATLTVVDLTQLVGTSTIDMVIIKTTSLVEWFVNGVSKGNSANVPSGFGVQDYDSIRHYITNGADSAAQSHSCHYFKVFTGMV